LLGASHIPLEYGCGKPSFCLLWAHLMTLRRSFAVVQRDAVWQVALNMSYVHLPVERRAIRFIPQKTSLDIHTDVIAYSKCTTSTCMLQTSETMDSRFLRNRSFLTMQAVWRLAHQTRQKLKTQEEITEDSCKKAKKVVHSASPDLPPEPEVAGPVATVCHES
jgi:hypothetical protein